MVPTPTSGGPRRGAVTAIGAGAVATLVAGVIALFAVGGDDRAAGPTTTTTTAAVTTTTTRAATTTTTRAITATTTSSTTTTRAPATTATSFPSAGPSFEEEEEEPAAEEEPPPRTSAPTTSPPAGTTTTTQPSPTTTQPSPTTTTQPDAYVQQWRWKDEEDPARRNDGFSNLPILQWSVRSGVQVEVLDPDQQVLSRANSGELGVCPGTVTTQSGQPPTCRTNVEQETTYTYTLRVTENGQEVRKLFLRLVVSP